MQQFRYSLDDALEDSLNTIGACKTASKILENKEVRDEIFKLVFTKSHSTLKSSLKKSILTAKKDKQRDYLLSVTPRRLCEEFRDSSRPAFELLVNGLLGLTNSEKVFQSDYLLNTVAFIYSTISKSINRKSTGYALLMTTMARDGGLREDSLQLFSGLCHPRTSQKYDKSTLAVGWDEKFRTCLENKKDHFREEKKVEAHIEELLQLNAATDAVESAKAKLETLLDTAPPQLQLVWDNLNLRTDHRFHRSHDEYSDSNLDWMSSLWIQDRIDANHMQNIEGMALKDINNLTVADFVPSEKEKNYVFTNFVHYFSYRLVHRHPILFQSIALSALDSPNLISSSKQ